MQTHTWEHARLRMENRVLAVRWELAFLTAPSVSLGAEDRIEADWQQQQPKPKSIDCMRCHVTTWS
jgi:hypothetical protein